MEVPRQIREQGPIQIQLRPGPQEGRLTLDHINHAMINARSEPDIYWNINQPSVLLKLGGARNYVRINYPDAKLYNRFVYWPDYKVAGSIKDIFTKFYKAGINKVTVGSIYDMSNGEVGCYRSVVPLSINVIIKCSIDPLNPQHQSIFKYIMPEDYSSKLLELQNPYSEVTSSLLNLEPIKRFPGGLPYQQIEEERLLPSQQKYRRELVNELSVLPSDIFPGFPGGSEYQMARERTVGRYGMNY